MSINNAKLILSPPIQQNIIDPATRMPVVGSVFFYKAGTSILKSVYQRSNDPDNPYVAAPNPLALNAAGALPFSIFAYPVDEADETTFELYDLVVKNSGGTEVLRINNWPETAKPQSNTINIADEYVVNGQFNYPFIFYSDAGNPGAVKFPNTGVCPGWEYETDAKLSLSDRIVTFEEILNDKEDDFPKYICIVDGTDPSADETFSRLTQEIGPVEYLSGQEVTFSFFGQDRNGNGAQLELRMLRTYGPSSAGASEPEDILLDTVTVTSTLSKFTKTVTIPTLDGKTVFEPSSVKLYFSYPVGSSYKIGITSVLARLGSISDPVFTTLPEYLLNAGCFGNSLDYQDYGVADNFGAFTFLNGKTILQRRTGEYARVDKDSLQQNMVVLKSSKQSLPVDGANKYGIPYRNLYNVLGDKWGSGGGLIVTTDDNVITFTANFDGEPKKTSTPYDGYDSGNTQWGLNKDHIANKYGVFAAIDSDTELTITANSNYVTTDKFDRSEKTGVAAGKVSYQLSAGGPLVNTFNSTYLARYRDNGGTIKYDQSLGDDQIQVASFAHGTSSTPWNTKLEFTATIPKSYESKTKIAKDPNNNSWTYASNAFGFSKTATFNMGSIFSGIPRQAFEAPDNLAIVIQVDGRGTWASEIENVTNLIRVQLSSSDTADTVVKKFKEAVNNPFKMVFTVNRTPTAGEYFKFADKNDRKAGWFKVDGVGTQPTVGDVDQYVEIDIQSTFSFKQVADAVKSTIKSGEFNIPSYTDVGMPQTGDDLTNNRIVVFL